MLGWLADVFFGLSRSQLRRINDELRQERHRLGREKRDQMLRGDRAELDLDKALHALAVARNDIQDLNQRAVEDARRIAKAAELLDDEREVSEDLRAENIALKAELATLRTLIGNARNQLDGRKAHTAEPACVGA